VKGTVAGVTTTYIGNYFEWTGSTSTMVKYYYAGSTRIAMRTGTGSGTTGLLWLFGDHLGSTSAVANADGTSGPTQLYKPWGEKRPAGASSLPTTYRYTGQRQESSLGGTDGLYFYGSRWLDPALGRFVSADTITPEVRNPQSWDRFAYANNNPLNYTDPSGHRPCETVDGTCLSERQVTKLWESTHSNERNKNNNKTVQADSPNLSKIISGDLEETGPITGFILQLPGSTEDWSSLATGLDVLAWLTDIYAASAVTYAGFAGAALPAPLVAAGLPEVPLATGLAGMAIAELYIQPVLFTGNTLASLSMGATIISDTKAGNTRIEESKYSISVLNSMALTDIGWMSNESYLSLIIQSISVANDMGWTSLPFPTIP